MSITIPEDGGLDRMKEREKKTVAVSSAGLPFVLLPVCHNGLTPQKRMSLSLKLSVQVLCHSDDKVDDTGMDLGMELENFRTCIL